MQFAQYTLPDFCRFSSGISPEIRYANVCVSIFFQIYLVFLISDVKKAHRFRHFRQSPPLSGFFPVFRPPSRLFPQGSGGLLRQRQPPLLMRSLHCAFQPGDSHASDVGYWLRMAPGQGRLPPITGHSEPACTLAWESPVEWNWGTKSAHALLVNRWELGANRYTVLSSGGFSRQEREPARKDCRTRTGPLPLPVWHVAFHAK